MSSELGDIFKIEFKMKENNKEVLSIKIEYFDTAFLMTSMALTKNGFLFCAGEKEDHQLYAIVHQEGQPKPYTHSQMAKEEVVEFVPRAAEEKGELDSSYTIEQFGPAADLKVADVRRDNNPNIYMLNSSGSGKSYLRIIKQGLRIREVSTVKYQKAYNLWSFKSSMTDEHDKLIIISFPSKTIAMTLRDTGYAQTKDAGIEESCETIHMGRLIDGSFVQVLPYGFRHIRAGIVQPVTVDGKILKATTRGRQMALALSGGDVIYY